MHSSTGPTGSPGVEHTSVYTVSVGLARIIGKVCQGHSSPKDFMRFMEIHHIVSQSSTPSWVLAFASLCLSGGCYSHHEVAHDADPQRLKGYLIYPQVINTFLHNASRRTRRAMHASGDAPCHASAKHHVLGACLSLIAPFRSMLLTLQSGLQR